MTLTLKFISSKESGEERYEMSNVKSQKHYRYSR